MTTRFRKETYSRRTYAEVVQRAERFARELNEALGREKELSARLVLLAKLAAKTPQFFNPMEAWAAETLRDEILKGRAS